MEKIQPWRRPPVLDASWAIVGPEVWSWAQASIVEHMADKGAERFLRHVAYSLELARLRGASLYEYSRADCRIFRRSGAGSPRRPS